VVVFSLGYLLLAGIARFPMFAPVAEPCSSVGVEHPEDAVLISPQELGHLDPVGILVQLSGFALRLQNSELAFGSLNIHLALPVPEI
jgi:hypothetical protein